MRIERIRSKNIAGLGDIDWTFPLGPALLLFEDKSNQKLFRDLLLTLFYDQQESLKIAKQTNKALVEVWISDDSFNYQLCYEFIEKENNLERLSTLVDKTGQTVYLPETMTIGDYLFRVQLQGFLQGGIVQWPENDDYNYLVQRINNLRQGGDEGYSLTKVRASIIGAQKKVQEQKESMARIKAEYDDLRYEWELAHRQQEDERLLQIEIKNLQENEKIVTEKIAAMDNLQKRLELFSQNPDYRELRQLQEELNRLEERFQNIEATLRVSSSETYVDWEVIEGLREECLEWACLQKSLGTIVDEAQARSKQIIETQNFLRLSRYEGFSENEDQLLGRAEKERDTAQTKLKKLLVIKRGLDKLEHLYMRESNRIKSSSMADVKEVDIFKISQKEKRLELWRMSKVGSILDRALRKRLGVTSIVDRLSSQLLQYYKRYHVTNYQEFTRQHKEFHDQRKRVENMKRQIDRLQEKVSQENNLRRIIHSRNKILKHAFSAVHVADYSEWLNGWEDYRRKKQQLSLELDELQLQLEQQSIVEKELTSCSELLRERLEDFGIPTACREEAFAAVLKVADKLQARDDAKREIAVFSERFHYLLGDRNMEQLSKNLEPLAELEREILLSNEVRLEEMTACYKRQEEIRQSLVALESSLKSNRKFPSLTVLEKKIEVAKRRWIAYEDLQHALIDARDMLELSWQEWETKYEKTLNEEKLWINDHCFSSDAQKSLEGEMLAKRDYFSYRMAVAQLALSDNIELPLFFSVGTAKNEDQNFWAEVADYLIKLSLSRQMLLSTTDNKLYNKLSEKGWSTIIQFA